MILKFSALACAVALSASMSGAQLFTNGGFETGNSSGWLTATSVFGTNELDVLASGVTQTPDGDPSVGADSGNWYAAIDEFGSNNPDPTLPTESLAVWQPIAIPNVGPQTDILSLNMFVYDGAGGSGLGAEVDIWAAGANPVTDAPLFVVFGPFDTATSPGVPNPYVALSQDISAHVTPGTNYLIGVFESDSFGPITVGIDNVSLVATAPEPGTMWLVGLLAAGMLFPIARRKARA